MHNQLSGLYTEREINSLSELIIKTVFNVDRLHAISDNRLVLTSEIDNRLQDIIMELRTGRPVQYIIGETEFYNCRIKVRESVLIPRQETEELVDLIIKENPDFNGNILDIGTGSGCIAIALAKYICSASVTGIDKTKDILSLAQENAELNNASVTFSLFDINHPPYVSSEKYNIIVSNPPYVRESEKKYMNINVLDFEPDSALFVPDSDPLIFYRKIIELMPSMMLPGGSVYFEINEAMGKEICEMMKRYSMKEVSLINDINGKQRIAKGKY